MKYPIKAELQSTIMGQAVHSKKLVEETHNVNESTIAVLQCTINSLRHLLSTNFHGQEILKLTKEIHNLLFDTAIPKNQQLRDVLKSQFNDEFLKIDGLKQWFEEQQYVPSSKGEVKTVTRVTYLINTFIRINISLSNLSWLKSLATNHLATNHSTTHHPTESFHSATFTAIITLKEDSCVFSSNSSSFYPSVSAATSTKFNINLSRDQRLPRTSKT